MSADHDERPPGELWQRSAEVVDVSYPDRTIELVVVPYETPALVGWEGRMVKETFARGSFDGIERRANRVRVNRDHQLERTVGRAINFHPSRDDGLVAEVRIAKTELGEETLALAADGCLDASAGFLPMNGGMQWQDRSSYRITKAWLGHIAMTPEPAYETARVLAVRHRDQPRSSTPNLDSWRAMLLEDRVTSGVALER